VLLYTTIVYNFGSTTTKKIMNYLELLPVPIEKGKLTAAELLALTIPKEVRAADYKMGQQCIYNISKSK
jgi:hypothetical protein